MLFKRFPSLLPLILLIYHTSASLDYGIIRELPFSSMLWKSRVILLSDQRQKLNVFHYFSFKLSYFKCDIKLCQLDPFIYFHSAFTRFHQVLTSSATSTWGLWLHYHGFWHVCLVFGLTEHLLRSYFCAAEVLNIGLNSTKCHTERNAKLHLFIITTTFYKNMAAFINCKRGTKEK